jgi:ubiquinone biosynthesis monooxygenase Coq7
MHADHADFARDDGSMRRRLSLVDRLVIAADSVLRTRAGGPTAADRRSPAARHPETALVDGDREVAVRLMRVNHSGEVAAQALYEGQALTARESSVRRALRRAAREEEDHLVWCADRVRELGGTPSALNPLWYAGSYAIGALAGLAGDARSLGFIAETERQVVEHLDGHLERLPAADERSRAILEQMQADEAKHGEDAERAGGEPMPPLVRSFMRLTARVMTGTAYWI